VPSQWRGNRRDSEPGHIGEQQAAARALGLSLQIVEASSERDLAPAFASLAANRASALYIIGDSLFTGLCASLAALAIQHSVPSIYDLPPIAAPVHSDAEIETLITSLGREPGGALFGGPDTFITNHRATIISLAARNHLPAIYVAPVCARDGGLISYGADFQDNFHRSAQYVNNILRGAKPSELPVQMPVKYLLIINLKTAKALGITVPQTLRVAADEVIQ
jgi:ABC-type uncharacterized transport system substrate-binding protein